MNWPFPPPTPPKKEKKPRPVKHIPVIFTMRAQLTSEVLMTAVLYGDESVRLSFKRPVRLGNRYHWIRDKPRDIKTATPALVGAYLTLRDDGFTRSLRMMYWDGKDWFFMFPTRKTRNVESDYTFEQRRRGDDPYVLRKFYALPETLARALGVRVP